MKSLIYGLVDPRTLLIRYVGKTVSGMHRARMHKYDPRYEDTKHTRVSRWIASLQRLGLSFQIVVLEYTSTSALEDAERWWIAYGRALGWPLTNLTDGGDGVTSEIAIASNLRRWSKPGERERMSAILKLRMSTPEAIARMTGENNPAKSAEARMKISARWDDPEFRAKCTRALPGDANPAKDPIVRHKISEAAKGKARPSQCGAANVSCRPEVRAKKRVLTEERALEAIRRYSEGGVSGRQLAREFGVSKSTMQQYLSGTRR